MPHRIVTALVIPADSAAYLCDLRADLATFQDLVGGYIQQVRVGFDALLYCNENGKHLGLPVNSAANALVRAAGPCLLRGDYLVGQVVVFGLIDPKTGEPSEDENDVPAHLLTLCDSIGVHVEDLRDR